MIQEKAEEEGLRGDRKLVYRFMGLPFYCSISIARRLGIARPGDERLSHIKVYQRWWKRIKEQQLRDELKRELDAFTTPKGE